MFNLHFITLSPDCGKIRVEIWHNCGEKEVRVSGAGKAAPIAVLKQPVTVSDSEQPDGSRMKKGEIKSGETTLPAFSGLFFYGQSEQYRLSQVDNVPVKSVLPQILAVP